jgi:hypothetical protein
MTANIELDGTGFPLTADAFDAVEVSTQVPPAAI